MRKFLISAALVTAAAVSAPVAAQYHGYDNRGGQQFDRQIDQLTRQIDQAYNRRLISGGEARSLRNRAQDIARRYDRYRRGGISRSEHDDLQRRIFDLRQRVRSERFEGREERRDRRW